MFERVDHIAVVVRNTEAALMLWRDRLGYPVTVQEDVNGGAVRLTHIDLGNVHLQLVEPLIDGHPLTAWLDEHGDGLHHICFGASNIDSSFGQAVEIGISNSAAKMHQGVLGKRAVFLDPHMTGVPLELTGV